MKYEKLFEKGKIGKLTLKNRIVMTPMGTGFAAASGEASEEITKFYEERAKGGVGIPAPAAALGEPRLQFARFKLDAHHRDDNYRRREQNSKQRPDRIAV